MRIFKSRKFATITLTVLLSLTTLSSACLASPWETPKQDVSSLRYVSAELDNIGKVTVPTTWDMNDWAEGDEYSYYSFYDEASDTVYRQVTMELIKGVHGDVASYASDLAKDIDTEFYGVISNYEIAGPFELDIEGNKVGMVATWYLEEHIDNYIMSFFVPSEKGTIVVNVYDTIPQVVDYLPVYDKLLAALVGADDVTTVVQDTVNTFKF